MQSNKITLIGEISHATNLDFTYVERTLNAIIADEVTEQTKQMKKEIETLQKTLLALESKIQTVSYLQSPSVNISD